MNLFTFSLHSIPENLNYMRHCKHHAHQKEMELGHLYCASSPSSAEPRVILLKVKSNHVTPMPKTL